MSQKLVILRGAPASGKTKLGESLRDFDKKIAWLSIDKVKPIFSDYRDESLDVVNGAAMQMLSYLLAEGFSVVLDGIFKIPEHIQKAIEIGKAQNVPTIIYQLKCSLEVLKERDLNKEGVKEGWRDPLGDKVIESLFKKVEANPIEGAIELDTENKSLEECLEIIRRNFQ